MRQVDPPIRLNEEFNVICPKFGESAVVTIHFTKVKNPMDVVPYRREAGKRCSLFPENKGICPLITYPCVPKELYL
jgi:hypothetical protein